MGNQKSSWLLGTAFLALVVLLASWFLAISPALDAAAATRAEEQAANDQNAVLTAKLVTLKEQFAHLEESKAELTGLQAQIPTTAELSTFMKTIASYADARGAHVLSLSAPVPVAVVPAGVDPAAVAAETDSAAVEAPVDGTSAVAVPAAVIPGFVAIPLDITMLGTVQSVTAFLTDLQTASVRLYLVSAFTGTGQGAKEATGGRPATAEGDIELAISGFLYVLQDTTSPAAPAGERGALPAGPGDSARLGGE